MISSLKNALVAVSNLSEDELTQIADIVTTRELKPGEFWFCEGMHSKDVAFVY